MRDIDGEAAQEKRWACIGQFIDRVEERIGAGQGEAQGLTGLTVRFPTEEEPTCLLIVRGTVGEGKRIAFVGSYRLGDAILAWRKRERGGRMKWREDLPWERRGG